MYVYSIYTCMITDVNMYMYVHKRMYNIVNVCMYMYTRVYSCTYAKYVHVHVQCRYICMYYVCLSFYN